MSDANHHVDTDDSLVYDDAMERESSSSRVAFPGISSSPNTPPRQEEVNMHLDWHPGDSFHPDAIEKAFDATTVDTDLEAIGPGFSWKVSGEFDTPILIGFYPKWPALFLSFDAGHEEAEVRSYTPKSVRLEQANAGFHLRVTARQGGIETHVSISSSGKIEEEHRFRFDIIEKMLQNDTMTVSEAAKVTGCSRRTIKYHISEGNLSAVLRGNLYLIDANDVKAYKPAKGWMLASSDPAH